MQRPASAIGIQLAISSSRPQASELSDPQACTSRPRHRGLARSERAELPRAALNAMWSGDSAPAFALRATPELRERGSRAAM